MEAEGKNTILVIEDDKNTSALIALYLRQEGFQAMTAQNGREGLEKAERHPPDLVILDLMLPEIDGWEVCRRLRQFSQVPVIMLTARGEEIDRVAGLTLGADDYVVKPFSPRELVARIKAVLRRAKGGAFDAATTLTHESLRMDLQKRRVYVNRRPVSLTRHEYILLESLMASPGKVFTRDELLGRIYPNQEATVIDRVVDVHVGKLRQKIEPDLSNPSYILTVRGIGYMFTDTTGRQTDRKD